MKKLIRALREIGRLHKLGEISEEIFENCRYDTICASVQIELDRYAQWQLRHSKGESQ